MDLREVKRHLSPKLLSIPGVAGIGLPHGNLTIYLEEDSQEARGKVSEVLQAEAAHVPVSYVVTGPFQARSAF